MSKLFKEDKPHMHSANGNRLDADTVHAIKPFFDKLWDEEGCNRAEILYLFCEAVVYLCAQKACHIGIAALEAKKTTSTAKD